MRNDPDRSANPLSCAGTPAVSGEKSAFDRGGKGTDRNNPSHIPEVSLSPAEIRRHRISRIDIRLCLGVRRPIEPTLL